MDGQGEDAPRQFAESAGDAFPTLLDAENALGQAFGFKAIPNGILVSPQGRIDAIVAGKFDIQRPQTKRLVEEWLAGREIPVLKPPGDQDWSAEALRLYREASVAVRLGDRVEAIRLLRLAYPLEPDNYIIRKQLWAIENPERFYVGGIDREWQDGQLELGR
jgi:hypothetical protein